MRMKDNGGRRTGRDNRKKESGAAQGARKKDSRRHGRKDKGSAHARHGQPELKAGDLTKVRSGLINFEQAYVIDTSQHKAGSPDSRCRVDNLTRAALWWISPDMTQLAATAARTLPQWTPKRAVPHSSGVVVWCGDTITVTHPITESRVPVRAAYWFVYRNRLYVTAYTDTAALPKGTQPKSAKGLCEAGVFTIPLTKWIPANNTTARDTYHVLQLLGATWLLAGQDSLTEKKPIRGQGKHSKYIHMEVTDGAGKQVSTQNVSLISIIQLKTHRHSNGQPAAADSVSAANQSPDTTDGVGDGEQDAGRGKVFHVRWVVRGHWRQQAVGPNHSEHKPVFIAPHVRGPQGAPLKTTVYQWGDES